MKAAQNWILCHKDGEILLAHCDCMAGAAEACSHVATILFAVQYLIGNNEAVTFVCKIF